MPRDATDGAGRLLTPGHDGTDGFFVARLGASVLAALREWRNLHASSASFLLIGFAGLALAAPVVGTARRRPDRCPSRLNCSDRARRLLATGKLDQAEDLLETALAVDPRNRWAFVDLARVARSSNCTARRSG